MGILPPTASGWTPRAVTSPLVNGKIQSFDCYLGNGVFAQLGVLSNIEAA